MLAEPSPDYPVHGTADPVDSLCVSRSRSARVVVLPGGGIVLQKWAFRAATSGITMDVGRNRAL